MGRFGRRNSGSPKIPLTIAHENQQNEEFNCFGDRLTLKMGCFGREYQLAL
ncbi:hypothetical protein H5410_029683 [Solanum commersonii]|uniref:Uncharacterized protein n=1 Tax=Solanum commersonii TaxID=4109 RepID=A0A9J5YDF0_SOLCO|nr:hypothetical protein H5410_029683 [Solanum commersonii]